MGSVRRMTEIGLSPPAVHNSLSLRSINQLCLCVYLLYELLICMEVFDRIHEPRPQCIAVRVVASRLHSILLEHLVD